MPPTLQPRYARRLCLALLSQIMIAVCVLHAPPLEAQAARTQVSEADDREARELFQAGQVAFSEARYERSLKYFEEAHALSQRHILLYNIAASLDRLQRKQAAIDAYRAYLDRVPKATNEAAVLERIDVLEAERARQDGRVMTPDQAARAQLAHSEPSDQPGGASQSDVTPIYKKWWLWTSLGVVVTVATVSILASQGNDGRTKEPLLLNEMTRVREL